MKSALINVVLIIIAHTNAFSWPEIFSPEEDSLGKFISDVVTDVRDTIDCTILSVERALSLDGLFETSPEYEEKCRGERSNTETSDSTWSDNQYANEETSVQSGNNDNQKKISEIDVSVSSVSTHIQSVIDESSKKETIKNVKDSLKTESDRLSQISAVLKKEVDKIPEEVRKKFKINSNQTSIDDIVEEVKLLYEYEIEQSDKSNQTAHEVRRIFYEVLTVLNVTDVNPPLSKEEEVKLILTSIYKHSNHSLVDVEKQISTWTKEGKRQITNIKNVVINVSQDISLANNKTNDKMHSSKHVTNKTIDETDNHKNKTTLCSVSSKNNTKIAQAPSSDCEQTINKVSVAEKRNVTSLSHKVTSFKIHKNNTASVDVVHNETRISSIDKPQNHNSSTLQHDDSKKDPVILKLLSIPVTATEKENKSLQPFTTTSLYDKNLHLNDTSEITTHNNVTNKTIDEAENHKNQTSQSSVGSKDNAERAKVTLAASEDYGQTKKTNMGEKRNVTSLSHSVTSFKIHKSNTTSVDVAHNETKITSTDKSHPAKSATVTESNQSARLQHEDSKTDPVILKLLLIPESATEKENTSFYANNLQLNETSETTTHNDVTNKTIDEAENHDNKTTLWSIGSKNNTERAKATQDVSNDCGQTLNKVNMGEKKNVTSFTHKVTSFTIHKSNTTSVNVAHNETRISSIEKSQNDPSAAETESNKSARLQHDDSKNDLLSLKLPSLPESAIEKENKSSLQPFITTTLYDKDLQLNETSEITTHNDTTNKIIDKSENHKIETIPCSVCYENNTERAKKVTQAVSDDHGQTINEASVGEKKNVTSLTHKVTSFTIHKSNTTSVDGVHNKTRISSIDKQKNHNSSTLTESKKSARLQHNDSKEDPVILKLLLIPETETKKENKSSLQLLTTTRLYDKDLQLNETRFQNHPSATVTESNKSAMFQQADSKTDLVILNLLSISESATEKENKSPLKPFTTTSLYDKDLKEVAEVKNAYTDSPKTKSASENLIKSSTTTNKTKGPLVAMRNAQLGAKLGSMVNPKLRAPSSLPKQNRTIPESATEKENKSPLKPFTTTSLYDKDLKEVAEVKNAHTDSPKTKSASENLIKSSTTTNKTKGPLVAMRNAQLGAKLSGSMVNPKLSAPSPLPKQNGTNNISTTGKQALDEQANFIFTPPSSTAKTVSSTTPEHTINQSESTLSASTGPQSRENDKIFVEAPSSQEVPVKSAKSEQFPKNFRDVAQQILEKSKTDTDTRNSEESGSGKFSLGALKQLFGPTANAEQREAVHDAQSIIEGSLKSQDFVKDLFSDTNSAPNIFDDPDYY